MNPFFGAHARSTLHGWFSSYSRDPRIEIESRVKGVNKQGFEAVLERLREGPWTAREAETLDRMHASGVRETIELASGKRTFLRKAKHAQPITIEISAEFAVRFALASEVECPPDDSRVISYRHKRRTSFVHKGMFAFELTRVNQGASKAQAQNSPLLYEIELEFCGQQLGEALPNPGYLTDSMLMKVSELLNQLMSVARNGTNPSKRLKALPGGLQEGTPVQLKEGTAVTLGPAGQRLPAPFGGKLKPQVAVQIPWVFSHEDPGVGGSGPLVWVMNLPCTFDSESYPLFYLYGHVPKDAILVQ